MANSNKSKTNSNSVPSAKYGLGLIAGILYLAFGIMQLTATVGFTMPFYESLYITGGIFNAFVLLVTAAVFLTGILRMNRNTAEADAFLDVGFLLSLAFGIVAILGTLAGGLDMWIGEEEEIVEGMLETVTPLLYMVVFGFLGYCLWAKDLFRKVVAA
ncbi:hypothetical protein [Methanomicrobium mobile]|uniref:hypothetical protein n=1 Tax=Methanomicrobium mobile TaxID=2205 RepID=UPI0005B2C71B|nr:hypothetical protein [Methanomicrobium mobile]